MGVSKADYMIGVDMMRRGFKPKQIGQAIEQASPERATRKAGHEADLRGPHGEGGHGFAQGSRRERDSGPSLD